MGPQARISTRNPHQPRARTPTITSRGSHSWSFLGLEKDGVVPPSSLWKKARYGEDVIIGNLDTEHPDVVSVFLNKARKLHTTHSWSFLGLEKDGVVPPSSLWKKARYGEDAIIGNLDTGEY
ncbi:hypothetical protein NC652_028586 [Populus alba x Populus x berolinensis]|nr:hypothetical protein NC652_028586 [Populus alba x Populus x berolinensis]